MERSDLGVDAFLLDDDGPYCCLSRKLPECETNVPSVACLLGHSAGNLRLSCWYMVQQVHVSTHFDLITFLGATEASGVYSTCTEGWRRR